jgi:membrane protein
LKLLQETLQQWQQDRVSRLAAALAYYTVFSVAPLLVIAVAIAGAVFGQEAAKAEIISQLENLVGSEGASAVVVALNNANQPQVGSIASLISVGVLLIGASGVFAQLQDALNTVWNVQPKPGKGIWGFVSKRLFSFLMVLAIGFLLLASLIISAVLSTVRKFNLDFLPGSQFLWSNIDLFISLGLLTFMFALMFKYVPDVKIAWKDVWVGAIITSLLFLLGKFLLGWYLDQGTLGSTYGAASSLIVFLAWVYYSAQIILFGAEFTQVYAHKYGSKILPGRSSQWSEVNN